MLIKKPSDIRSSEITPRDVYLNRRAFMRAAALTGGSLLAGEALPAVIPEERRAKLEGVVQSAYSNAGALFEQKRQQRVHRACARGEQQTGRKTGGRTEVLEIRFADGRGVAGKQLQHDWLPINLEKEYQ